MIEKYKRVREALLSGVKGKASSLIGEYGIDFVEDGVTLLHCAVSAGEFQLVEFLLSEGADKDKKDYTGCTALSLAVEKKLFEIAKLLVSKGADVNLASGSGGTPLYVAASNGDKILVELLLENGADTSKTSHDLGDTIFHSAVVGANVDVIKLLVDEGVDINLKNRSGYTALHYAVSGSLEDNKCDFVMCLVANGADIMAKGTDFKTPLDIVDNQEYKTYLNNVYNLALIMGLYEINYTYEERTKAKEELKKYLGSCDKKEEVCRSFGGFCAYYSIRLGEDLSHKIDALSEILSGDMMEKFYCKYDKVFADFFSLEGRNDNIEDISNPSFSHVASLANNLAKSGTFIYR